MRIRIELPSWARSCAVVVFGALIFVAPAAGQRTLTAPLLSEQVPVEVDSGPIRNDGEQPDVVFATMVQVPGALWLRLDFDRALLAGSLDHKNASYLQITSLQDGGRQTMNAVHVTQWQDTSAYFNGDAVLIEIIAYPGTGNNRLIMSEVTAGVEGGGVGTICGTVDDRELSQDPRAGRAIPIGCTAWLIDDANHCFLTAGHCTGNLNVVEFNVPLSDGNRNIRHPPPEDQYAVDRESLQTNGGQGIGNDWGYFGCFANSNTGLTPFEAQGDFYHLRFPPPAQGQDIRITGYGTTSPPAPPQWSQVQKTHAGPYVTSTGTVVQYRTDTSGGNSGSPVIFDDTGEAIGIHTHGGCSSGGGQNSGTGVNHSGLQNALKNPKGVCIPVPFTFDFPDGLPELLDPAGGTRFRVVLEPVQKTPKPGSGLLHVDTGGGFEAVAMIEVQENIYDAVFPPIACGRLVKFYVSARTTDEEIVRSPKDAPDTYYDSVAGLEISVALEDDFENDMGWTIVDVNVAEGGWERAQPDPNGRDGSPNVDYDGSGKCYLTGAARFEDLDGGPTRLFSPTLDLSNAEFTVSYAFWFFGGADDTLKVHVSNNGGQSWTLVVSHERSDGWETNEFNPADFVELTDNFKVRFAARDLKADTRVEAGIDAFRVSAILCDEGRTVDPQSFDVTRGVLKGGDLADLLASDDAYVEIEAVRPTEVAAASVEIELTAVSPSASPAELRFSVEAAASALPVRQRVSLFNYKTGQWEILDEREAPQQDTVTLLKVTNDPARFIESGSRQMKTRIGYHDLGVTFVAWGGRFDRAFWAIVE